MMLPTAAARHLQISFDSWYMAISTLKFMRSALTLLVGHQEEHPACKKLSDELMVWLSVWSEVQIVTSL